MHAATFSVLFLIGQKSFPKGKFWWQLHLGLIVYGVVMELLQGQTGYRSMEAWDLVADFSGQLLGHFLLFFREKKSLRSIATTE